MKLIILKNNIVTGLNVVEKAVGVSSNLPILKYCLIKAQDNKIILTTTNLEFVISYTIFGKIMEAGDCAAPFSIFNSIVKNIPSDRITIEVKDKKLTVLSDNYEASLQIQDAKDFPIIPSIQNTNQCVTLKNNDFRELTSSVVIATQFSEIRPEISGVFLQYREGELIGAATDSFRLAEYRLRPQQIESSLKNDISVIIPLQVAQELLRAFTKDEEKVSIFIDPTQILFKSETQEVVSRLVDGKFPDYQTIIPKQTQHEVVVDRQEFINAVKLVSVFSGRTNDITLRVESGKKFLEIFSAQDALGENHYRLPVKVTGGGFSVSFNWRYLIDGLKIYKSDEIVLGVSSNDQPAVIKHQTDPLRTYVLMPIKV